MKYNFIVFILLSSYIISAQNVGVGTTNPGERLDVNGNINVSGTIKANGTDGTANQVLMKNNSGVLAWGDLCDYKNVATFTATGPGNWTVPAGVTKIVVEVWGAGAGGTNLSGGGGGGYVRAAFTVIPGDNIAYVVGEGGTGVVTDFATTTGDASTVTVGAYTVSATGGFGGGGTTSNMTVATGGSGSVSGLYKNFIALTGEIGKFSANTFFSSSSTTYEYITSGKGGDGANSQNTGSNGRERMQSVAPPFTLIKASNTSIARQPGGGGGAGYSVISTGINGPGSNGGPGLVIIRY